MKIVLSLILLTILCTGCITKKPRNLLSPCAAGDAYSVGATNKDVNTVNNPCVKRPVNVWLS